MTTAGQSGGKGLRQFLDEDQQRDWLEGGACPPDADERSEPLRQALREAKKPDGTKAYTPLVALSLMVFFALAMQCMSTLAVVRRESGGLRWPLFMFGYMTVLAYVASLLVYQGGRLLGFG